MAPVLTRNNQNDSSCPPGVCFIIYSNFLLWKWSDITIDLTLTQKATENSFQQLVGLVCSIPEPSTIKSSLQSNITLFNICGSLTTTHITVQHVKDTDLTGPSSLSAPLLWTPDSKRHCPPQQSGQVVETPPSKNKTSPKENMALNISKRPGDSGGGFTETLATHSQEQECEAEIGRLWL